MKDAALILAAGKGTRMQSDTPKALQTLLGEPMLAHVAGALRPVFGENLWAVIGHGADEVEAAFAGHPFLSDLTFVRQTEQLGTGHALMVSLPHIEEAGVDRLVVVNGDMPLISTDMMRHILSEVGDADMGIASITLPEPGAYGRVVRDPHTCRCTAVVEAKDYDERLHGPATGEINIGLYVLRLAAIKPLLSGMTTANKSGEYYITDLVRLAASAGLRVHAVSCGSNPNLLGVNNPEELALSEDLLRERIVRAHLLAGVRIHQPGQLVVGPFVTLEPGAEVSGPGFLLGSTRVARAAQIGPFCHVLDSHIEAHAAIQPFCHLQSAHVGPQCTVGPYARLRPGAELETAAHVGNFVEMKKARLGKGAKANHLTYLGDADVGEGSNIGAGTITCNYDGKNKFQTVIGHHAFIGSNSSLVAPVRIGNNALVGAGSTITADVPDNALALARGRQVVKEKKNNNNKN